jgi:hypothetical protein
MVGDTRCSNKQAWGLCLLRLVVLLLTCGDDDTVAAAAVVAGATASPGCQHPTLPPGQRHLLPLNKTVMRNVTVTDRNQLTVNRRYAIHLPSSYSFDKPEPLPLLLYIHGQTETAKGDLPPYAVLADKKRFIVVSGQGLDEGGDCGTGWYTGNTSGTCTREAWSEYGANATCCYPTCRQLGRCRASGEGAHCGWSTCFEDLDFFSLLLRTVEAELCVDTEARFATGGSNGGMMVHRIAGAMPHVFVRPPAPAPQSLAFDCVSVFALQMTLEMHLHRLRCCRSTACHCEGSCTCRLPLPQFQYSNFTMCARLTRQSSGEICVTVCC